MIQKFAMFAAAWLPTKTASTALIINAWVAAKIGLYTVKSVYGGFA